MKERYHRVRGNFQRTLPKTKIHRMTVVRKNQTNLVTDTEYQTEIPWGTGDYMTDVVTPGYRELSAKGIIINNPMEADSATLTFAPFTGQYDFRDRKNKVVGTGVDLSHRTDLFDWIPTPVSSVWGPLDSYDLAWMQAEAINSAISKSKQRNVLGLVDFAERAKTLELVKVQMNRLSSLLNSVKLYSDPKKLIGRGRRKKGMNDSQRSRIYAYQPKSTGILKRVGQAADVHLEIQYGILPLMSTIEGLLKTLDSSNNTVDRQTYRGFKTDNNEVSSEVEGAGVYYGSTLLYKPKFTHTHSWEVQCRAGVMTSYHASVKAQLGLEVTDILSSGYELIRFSFVLDWLWNVGKFLEAVTPVVGYKQDASWITTTIVEEEFWKAETFSGSASDSVYNYYTYPTVCTIHRSRDYKIRTPGISARIPRLNTEFKSITHLLSGLALTVSTAKSSAIARL